MREHGHSGFSLLHFQLFMLYKFEISDLVSMIHPSIEIPVYNNVLYEEWRKIRADPPSQLGCALFALRQLSSGSRGPARSLRKKSLPASVGM